MRTIISGPFHGSTSGQSLVLPLSTSSLFLIVGASRVKRAEATMLSRDRRVERVLSKAKFGHLVDSAASVGKHYFKRAFHYNSPAAHTGVIGTAFAMGGSKRVSAQAAAPVSRASAAFNPGGSGGYKGPLKQKRKSKRSVLRAKKARAFKRKVRSALNMRLFARGRQSHMFPIMSSVTVPCIPLVGPYGQTITGMTTTLLPPSSVGWNLIECPTHSQLITRINSGSNAALASAPWTSTGVNTLHQYEFADQAEVADQISFHQSMKFRFEFKNNSNGGAKVVLYFLKCTEHTNVPPMTEFVALRNAAYVNAANPLAVTDPETMDQDWEQYWTVPLQGRSRNWSIEKSMTFQLNGGDTCSQSINYSFKYPYRSVVTAEYTKGSYCILARIEGTLQIDSTNPSLYNYTGAVIGCHMSRSESISISRKEYDVVNRLGNTVDGAVVTGVVSGDANAFNYNN